MPPLYVQENKVQVEMQNEMFRVPSKKSER